MNHISFVPYQLITASFNPWREIYIEAAQALIAHISHPEFEFIHFGSTSFKVAGKGIIDISILYQKGDLNKAVSYLKQIGFEQQHSNDPFPDERPRKDIGIIYKNENFQVHAHVIELNSEIHQKQINFKNYMLNNEAERLAYEKTKQEAILKGFIDQDAYGKAKTPFVKSKLKQLQMV